VSAADPQLLPGLSPGEARRVIAGFAGTRLVIVGDLMLDQFLFGRVERISPEAPVPVLQFDHEEYRLGGAANVAHKARALGATVDLVGVAGDDATAERLGAELRARGLGADGLVTDPSRRTTLKVRLVTMRNQQVARLDYENDREVDESVEDALVAQVAARAGGAGVIIVSDYLKGVVTRRLVARIVALGQERGLPVLVDPKIPHVDYYTGATLVTPNHHEAETAAHMRIGSHAEARRAAEVFRQRARCDGVLITRGEHGLWLSADGVEGYLPATAREVADVTGAGDTVIATLALALAAGAGGAPRQRGGGDRRRPVRPGDGRRRGTRRTVRLTVAGAERRRDGCLTGCTGGGRRGRRPAATERR
jgi:rfaE bifunctional protein kinase chain/domain